MLRYTLLIGCLLTIALLPGQTAAPLLANNPQVQAVLTQWAATHPQLIGTVKETGRRYLLKPRRDATPEPLVEALQIAFYQDFSGACQLYGRMYLVDWRALLAKSARETFWGASFLCNRANNYFGIRSQRKEWICDSFQFCDVVNYRDPEPADFAVFPGFESSLWMFVHTIYNYHYLARLPDGGARVAEAIYFERRTGGHYWDPVPGDYFFALQLPGSPYTSEEVIYTWSEHEINNLCINCTRDTDREWIARIADVQVRAAR